MSRTVRRLQVFAVALWLAATMCAGQQSQQTGGTTASQGARAFSQKRNIEGVPNFGEVTPKLFRGAQPTHEGFEGLAKMGIGIVVDARAGNRTDSEGRDVGKLGMQYVSIPWHCTSPSDDVMVRFLKVIRENPDKKVFVHCRLGKDRTGMMVAAYRMALQNWTADEALQEMQEFGFSTGHHFFCPRLAPYEKSFPERLVRNPALGGLPSSADGATK